LLCLFRILGALACVIVLACNSASEIVWPCPRPSFILSPQLDTIAVGASLQYGTAFPTGQSVPPTQLEWSSTDARIASVDSAGMARARSPGLAGIHAVDPSSPPSCPDAWSGTLVVQ
jgi:hypothetical protein